MALIREILSWTVPARIPDLMAFSSLDSSLQNWVFSVTLTRDRSCALFVGAKRELNLRSQRDSKQRRVTT